MAKYITIVENKDLRAYYKHHTNQFELDVAPYVGMFIGTKGCTVVVNSVRKDNATGNYYINIDTIDWKTMQKI